MSDVTDQYLLRVRQVEEGQYDSLGITLSKTMHHQGYVVKQISVIAGARSINEQDLRDNLKFFKVPEATFESIRKLVHCRNLGKIKPTVPLRIAKQAARKNRN